MAQHFELVVGHTKGLLLERKREPVDDEETDEVARRPDGQITELERLSRPRRQRQLPRQIEQSRAAITQPQPRKPG
jgi:hypothetical protein